MPEGNHVFETVAKPPVKIRGITGRRGCKHQFFKITQTKMGCGLIGKVFEKSPREEASDMQNLERLSIMGQQREGFWQEGLERIVKVQAV